MRCSLVLLPRSPFLFLLIIIFWVKKVALLNDYKEEEFAKVSKVVEEAKQEEFRRLEVKEDSG